MTEYTADQVLQRIQEWAEQCYQQAGQKVEVALHGGRFTTADLKRYATAARACRIALEGLRFEVTGRGELITSGQVVVVVLAGDNGKKDTRALNACCRWPAYFTGRVAGQPLQPGAAGHRAGRAQRSLYNAALDAAGTTGWVITWPV
ncbi:hypothetical protein, partial [Ectopseudomonas oleovorans]|uniref:hypothetical protein n=1 Tax=Ectopseudomonas oleovorans TaxID=301 RepID=UPI003F1C3B9E